MRRFKRGRIRADPEDDSVMVGGSLTCSYGGAKAYADASARSKESWETGRHKYTREKGGRVKEREEGTDRQTDRDRDGDRERGREEEGPRVN